MVWRMKKNQVPEGRLKGNYELKETQHSQKCIKTWGMNKEKKWQQERAGWVKGEGGWLEERRWFLGGDILFVNLHWYSWANQYAIKHTVTWPRLLQMNMMMSSTLICIWPIITVIARTGWISTYCKPVHIQVNINRFTISAGAAGRSHFVTEETLMVHIVWFPFGGSWDRGKMKQKSQITKIQFIFKSFPKLYFFSWKY